MTVATVGRLWHFPVKSMQGEEVDEVLLGPHGIAGVGHKQISGLGQFACAGSYAEVVTPGAVRRGDSVRIERVQPRQGALAATIDMMTAALAADS